MKRLPSWLLRDHVELERYLGESSTGPRYGKVESVPMSLEAESAFVASAHNERFAYDAVALTNEAVAEGSRITHNSVAYRVVFVKPLETVFTRGVARKLYLKK